MSPRELQLIVAITKALEAAGLFLDEEADCHTALSTNLSVAVLENALPDNLSDWFKEQIRYQLREWLIAKTHDELGSFSPTESERVQQQQVFRRELMGILYRASGLVAAARLGPAEVAAMLSEAGAPQPADPANIIHLAGACLTIAMTHQHFLGIAEAWERDAKIWREAREAQNKMRQLMPLIIGHSKLLDGLDPTLQGRTRKVRDDALLTPGHVRTRLRVSERTKNYQRFTRELEKLEIWKLELPAEVSDDWHDHAGHLAHLYLQLIDPHAGWSRSGPAVRFLEKALWRAYPDEKITRVAIELHLSRLRRA